MHYFIHYFFYIIDIYIVITAEHPSHGVKGAFLMFPSPYNINLLIIYLFTYSYVIYLCNLWSKLNKSMHDLRNQHVSVG